jgi:biotin transport system substrate-specific component
MESASRYAVAQSRSLRTAAAVIVGSLFLSLCSYVQIPLFFTPIPLVIQNSIAVALGAVLGARKGLAAVLLFLTYGSLGAPVFAGEGGLSVLLSPLSGGYLAGYALAAFATGKICEHRPSLLLPAVFVGHLLILLIGASVASLFVGCRMAWQWGIAPFIVFDAVKAVATYKLLLLVRRHWL